MQHEDFEGDTPTPHDNETITLLRAVLHNKFKDREQNREILKKAIRELSALLKEVRDAVNEGGGFDALITEGMLTTAQVKQMREDYRVKQIWRDLAKVKLQLLNCQE